MRPRVEVLVERSEGDELRVLSPLVGWFRQAHRPGELVSGGAVLGRLHQLGRVLDLVLPAASAGRVSPRASRELERPVGYGEELLRLAPIADVAADDAGPRVTGAGSTDGLLVTSPTHGMFYRRPGPDLPPYVEIGQVVESGTTLGLVEVMKCFSAITYGGEGLPPRAEIVEARATDASEVQSDQVLFVVKAV